MEDVMEELDYGPNGGLIYCLEYVYLQAPRRKVAARNDAFLVDSCSTMWTGWKKRLEITTTTI